MAAKRKRTARTARPAAAKRRARNPGPARAKTDEVPIVSVPEHWRLEPGGKAIAREVRTEDFVDAVSVINDIVPVAEDLNHHPDLHIERYNRLRIVSYSHDVGKLTDRDERLARRLNEVLAKRGL